MDRWEKIRHTVINDLAPLKPPYMFLFDDHGDADVIHLLRRDLASGAKEYSFDASSSYSDDKTFIRTYEWDGENWANKTTDEND
jgi:hypothetical protein